MNFHIYANSYIVPRLNQFTVSFSKTLKFNRANYRILSQVDHFGIQVKQMSH
jgi:hypothetical protein